MKNGKRLLALVLFFSLTFTLVSFAAEEGRFVKVTAYDVNIRAGAGTDTQVVGHADYGDSFEVVTTQNGWYQVRQGREQTGWISAALVHEGSRFATKNPTIDTAEATAADVNVRDGASTAYDVITTIHPDTRYPLLQMSGDWVQIRLPDERTGWVSKSFVSVAQDKAKTLAEGEQQQGTVIADTLNVRQSPNEAAQVVGTLAQGEIVKMTGDASDGFVPIEYRGQTAYVKSEYVKLPSQPAPAAAPSPADGSGPTLTLTEPTNIRNGPGTNFAIVRTGEAGSTFSITGQAGQWLQIALQDGKTGYVANWLPKINGTLDKVPQTGQSLDGGLRGKTIIIDAGHGGYDVGAVGVNTGLYEKDATYSLSRILYNKLIGTGANVVLTRSDDSFVSLADRVEISKDKQADAFVSIHYNTNENHDLSGTMTFYYSEDGPDRKLAQLVQDEVVKATGETDRGTRFGDYYVLRENPQTAVLVETAFLTNESDEKNAKDSAMQEKAAEGIFQALVEYFK